MAMAISVVTSPRSSRNDGERTADEIRQEVLYGVAFQDNGEQAGETRRRHGGDGVFRGCRTAFVGWGCTGSKGDVHLLRMRENLAQ